MKKLVFGCLFLCILSVVSQGQEIPQGDVAVGYSLLFLPKGFTLTLNGGSNSVAYNFNPWLGVAGDFGVYNGSPGIPGLIGETYLFGPRFSYRKWNRLTPFAQGLVGGAHANSNNGGFLAATNAFAAGGGAGGDLSLDRNRRFALRAQLDLLNFHAGSVNTGAVRFSTGIVFRIGRKQ